MAAYWRALIPWDILDPIERICGRRDDTQIMQGKVQRSTHMAMQDTMVSSGDVELQARDGEAKGFRAASSDSAESNTVRV